MLLQFREQASSQSFPDLGIPNESQFRAVGIIIQFLQSVRTHFFALGFGPD
jgi:hypothetical protein